MNFVFEKILSNSSTSSEEYLNFIECPDVNPSGIRRFTISPLVSTMLRFQKIRKTSKNFDYSTINISNNPDDFSKYIIASGVTHSPYDWCGAGVHSLFKFLNQTYLRDLRRGKALLLLDQSHEGYHEDWMFQELHNQCLEYGVNPRQIIYVTGNLIEDKQYDKWTSENNVADKMCIVTYSHFEYMIYDTMKNRTSIFSLNKLPNFLDHIKYKIKNLSTIKTYNCLQKRPRAHRAWMFKGLVDYDLLDYGINSMNFIEHKNTYYANKLMTPEEYERIKIHMPILPPTKTSSEDELKAFSDINSGKYIQTFNEETMLQSWLSVTSESSFAEDSCFLSEKSYKPIAGSHPFMILGNRYSLRRLRELGYKTFHPFIDETYDDLDTWDRLDAMHRELKRINSFSNIEKLYWFKSMGDILQYNLEHLIKKSVELSPDAFLAVKNHFEDYNVPITS